MATLKASKKGTTTKKKQTANGTIQAVDLPVGVAARAAERVRPYVAPLRDREQRDPHIQKIRGQLVTELKQSEARGAELRRKAVAELRPMRVRVEQELARTRGRLEAEVRVIRPRAEETLRRLQTTARERLPV
jgi:hypothetical protein